MKERYLVTFTIDNKKQYLHDDLKLTNRLFIFKNFELACKCAEEYSLLLKNDILSKTNISEIEKAINSTGYSVTAKN